jgi:hypothetical protein
MAGVHLELTHKIHRLQCTYGGIKTSTGLDDSKSKALPQYAEQEGRTAEGE